MDTCWKCGYNGVDLGRDTFCTRCGVLLENYCPSEECSTDDGHVVVLDAYDRFCYRCGSPSKFMGMGYFDSES